MFMTSASGLNPQWRKNILWNKSKHVKNNKNKLNKWNIAKIWSQIDEVIKVFMVFAFQMELTLSLLWAKSIVWVAGGGWKRLEIRLP